MKKILPSLTLLGASFAFHGCATHISSNVVENPPPAEKFSGFTRFEMLEVKVLPPYAGQEANEKALVKIRENVIAKMTPLLAAWNATGATSAASRTLVIEPIVPEIKFINATARVWSGALSGSSAVVLRARITEKETGKVVATPEFFARAAAMSGAYSFGGADNAMLVRISNRLTDYLQANYANAVGGPSGKGK
jgi:hypothetical protein